ncbi:MAG: MoaD/ThiS family protein [Deltaproteobacteria bacterium]|nr:MoaD/ThiS family protein [Deltaproteobacteria bacterium]
MITVTLKAYATLRDILGKELRLTLPRGTTVGSLLNDLAGRYPALRGKLLDDDGAVGQYFIVLKNGRNILFAGGLDALLEDGDSLSLFPPVAGG